MTRFQDKVVVVTGGGSGIGREVALALATEGASVAILDSNEEGAEKVAKEAGVHAAAYQVDVSNEHEVEKVFKALKAKFGALDGLFNNAGIQRRSNTMDMSLADWNAVIAVNMTGLMLCARQAVKYMKPGSSIVNTASALGYKVITNPTVAYGATKAAVIHMTRIWALEWGGLGIRVNGIAPSVVKTPFTAALLQNPEFMKQLLTDTPLGRITDLNDIPGPVLFLLSDDSRMVTGHTIPIDGGISVR